MQVVAGHHRPAPRRLAQAAEHLHGRGLARTVGPEKTEYLPLIDRERDMVDSREVPETFREPFRAYHLILPEEAVVDVPKELTDAFSGIFSSAHECSSSVSRYM